MAEGLRKADRLLEEVKAQLEGETKRHLALLGGASRMAEGLMENLETYRQRIEALSVQADEPSRDRQIYLYRLLYKQTATQLEVTRLQPAPGRMEALKANMARVQHLSTEIRYLEYEMAVVNYLPVIETLGEALNPPKLRAPTKPLSGTGGLTTRLSPPTTGTGALRGGTGKLPAARGGTGPLPAPSWKDEHLPRLREAAAREEQASVFRRILEHYRAVSEAMAPLRGAEPGTLAMPASDAHPILNQVAGKIYYLNRAIEQLDAPLADLLSFKAVVGATSERAPKAPKKKEGLTTRLKGLLGKL